MVQRERKEIIQGIFSIRYIPGAEFDYTVLCLR